MITIMISDRLILNGALLSSYIIFYLQFGGMPCTIYQLKIGKRIMEKDLQNFKKEGRAEIGLIILKIQIQIILVTIAINSKKRLGSVERKYRDFTVIDMITKLENLMKLMN